jgi:hypothetical protein
MDQKGVILPNLYVNAAICLLFQFVQSPANAENTSNLGWLSYGDLRGHIEPCGCDPRTDLGGVLRLGTILARDRSLQVGTRVFDLGNNLSEEIQDRTKNEYINGALDSFLPDAALINAVEFRLKTYLFRRRNFVLSNFTIKKADTHSLAVRDLGAVKVYGYLWIDGTQVDLLPWQQAFDNSWREKVRKVKSHKVLLFSGPDAHLQEIIKERIFDEVIASNGAPLSTVIVDQEKIKPRLLMRVATEPVVFQTPLGGQGLLRGGALRRLRQKPLAELLGAKPLVSRLGELPVVIEEEVVTWLTPEYAVGSPTAALMERYKKTRGEDFAALRVKKLAFLSKTPFAGADKCKACHEPEWQVWNQTAHPKAYSVLKDKQKHEDPECVNCHVLGYAIDGGFASLGDSPKFAGVQCENCHGAGAAHSLNPTVKLAIADKTVCVGCHFPPHTAEFNFDEYWTKIRHGKAVK